MGKQEIELLQSILMKISGLEKRVDALETKKEQSKNKEEAVFHTLLKKDEEADLKRQSMEPKLDEAADLMIACFTKDPPKKK